MKQHFKRKLVLKAAILLFGGALFQYCTADNEPFTIYTIGDSTMADKEAEDYPETGWCQVLGAFLDGSVTVENHARNGRSSKSFIEEGWWQAVRDSLKTGDYVFIQFGHNDGKQYDSSRYTSPFGSYTENLENFVIETREKGATPVLFTSIIRRKFDKNGILLNTHGDYPVATRLLAERLVVPLIDLQQLTEEWIQALGDEASREMFLWVPPCENYPEGKEDDTHLSEKGANVVARLALEECIKIDLSFAKSIVR